MKIYKYIIVFSLTFFNCSSRTPVEFYAIKKQEVRETVLANGRMGGSRIITLSLQKSGIISKVAVKDGSEVKRGDTIIILDNKEEANRVAQAKTSVDIARINLSKSLSSDAAKAHEELKQSEAREELAKKEWERGAALQSQGALAQAELDRLLQNYTLAASIKRNAESRLKELEGPEQQLLQARLDQAKSQYESAIIDLSRTILKAPDKGQIVRLGVQRGESVNSSTSICDFLQSDTTTYVELLVDEDAARSIRAGQKAFVSAVSDTNKPFEAFVKSVIPLIDASRGTVTVQLAITSNRVDLLPDQTVSAQIVVRSFPEALSAPQRFFKNENGKMLAFSKSGNKAVLREVKTEALGGSLLRIDSGLSESDTLLFAPVLKDNATITIRKN